MGYNFIPMSKKEAIKKYQKWEGVLEKKSNSIFLGFQRKVWKVMEEGTKIGYRNEEDNLIAPDKIFHISEIETEEMDDETAFQLHTKERVFQLRAQTAQERREWMRAINVLQKEWQKKQQEGAISTKKPANIRSNPNDSTMVTVQPKNEHSPIQELQEPLTPNKSRLATTKSARSFHGSRSFTDGDKEKAVSELLKKIPPTFADYHVFAMRLKTQMKDLIFTTVKSHYFIFFSSKSLFPEDFITDQNLNSSQLPHWAQVDCFYRLTSEGKGRLLFQLPQIVQTQQDEEICALRVTTAEDEFEFICDSLQDRRELQRVFRIGKENAIEARINGVLSRKNYDNLIWLHDDNLEQFNYKVGEMIAPLTPTNHKFELDVIARFIENLSPVMVEVMSVVEHKIRGHQGVVLDFLKVIHEEVRIHLKLVWDTSHGVAKGGEVLGILKATSYYEGLIHKYIQDKQMLDALKELSKCYMRACYKNFENLIRGIVQLEKKDTVWVVEDEGEHFVSTHAITDLFKFIYQMFDLTVGSWQHKLHLHNTHRLIKRAITVFLSQLKAMVDEEEISIRKLVAIANNYVRFNNEIDAFYEEKLSSLKEQTRQYYDKMKDQYRQISLIIIEKAVLPLKIQFKIYFEKMGFHTFSMEEVYRMISKSELQQLMPQVHFILRKRYYQRLFATLREAICKLLEKEAKATKKKKQEAVKKAVQRLASICRDCVEMAQSLCDSKLKIEKDFWEVQNLLMSPKKEEISLILSESNELFKRIYKNILGMRSDYENDSPLKKHVQLAEVAFFDESPLKPNNNFLRVEVDRKQRKSSFSKYYEVDRGSIESVERMEMAPEEKRKMISSGLVRRRKNKSTNYEWIYLKLKQAVLYIYENEAMERCQNTIKIEDIQEVACPNPQKANIHIVFNSLSRNKEMKIKCNSLEESIRWAFSLQSEMKRLSNDRKMKTKSLKIKEKNHRKLVIDYQELANGPDYFSYGET